MNIQDRITAEFPEANPPGHPPTPMTLEEVAKVLGAAVIYIAFRTGYAGLTESDIEWAKTIFPQGTDQQARTETALKLVKELP